MSMLYDLRILVILIAAFLCEGIPTVLHLERSVSISISTNFSHLVQRDRARHGRLLQSSNGVINYTLGGIGDFSIGLYYTRIQLGTPPSNYYVQVDTGSDVTWIGCVPCASCSTSTWIANITLHLYNPLASSTYSAVSCHDSRCPTGIQPGSNCSEDNNHCLYYSVDYADLSSISGIYVKELLSYDRIVNSRTVTSAVPFVFGCTTVENQFSSISRTDGILGLGHQGISLISQLADQGLSPKVFSHCLRGDGDGGGILVLGEIAEPDIIYSPLIPSQPHYNLDLQKISVNGQTLPIDPHLLSSQGEQGAVIDSGTTFMYLEIDALMQVISAINGSTSAESMPSSINQQLCYLVTSTVDEVFPPIILHFAGGADLILGPRDYLLYQASVMGGQMWCTMFQANTDGGRQTILGDMVMKNKYIIYDLTKQRIGWKNYDCSKPVHVSTGIIKPKHGRTRRSDAGRSSSVPLQFVSWCFLVLYLHHIP